MGVADQDPVRGLIEGTSTTAREAGVRDFEEVRRQPGRLASFTPPARETSGALKTFLREKVYYSESILEERRRSIAMLDELFRSGRIKKGERLLMYIPESGRFSTCFIYLEAV